MIKTKTRQPIPAVSFRPEAPKKHAEYRADGERRRAVKAARRRLGQQAIRPAIVESRYKPNTSIDRGQILEGPAAAKRARNELRQKIKDSQKEFTPQPVAHRNNSTRELSIVARHNEVPAKTEKSKASRLRKIMAIGAAAISIFGLSFAKSSNQTASEVLKTQPTPVEITVATPTPGPITVNKTPTTTETERKVAFNTSAETPWEAVSQQVGEGSAATYLNDVVAKSNGKLSWHGQGSGRYLETDTGASDTASVVSTINNLPS